MVDTLELTDYLRLKSTDGNNYVDLKCHQITIPNSAPILVINQGLWAIKDIHSLGYLSTVSKTELVFASTYTNCVPADVGKQVKVNGSLKDLVLAGYDNSAKKWWLSGSISIASGSQMALNSGTGAGTTSGTSSTYGGGAILIGHGLTSSTDVPKIILSDSAQGYDKLYIRKLDGTPAHMELGNLTTHGGVDVGSSADGVNRAITIRGPNANGQTASLNFFDTMTYIKAVYGSNLKLGSYWGIDFYVNQNNSTPAMNLSTNGDLTVSGRIYLTGNSNGYLWNNGGYIRQSGGSGFIADGYVVVGTYGTGTGSALYGNASRQICQGTSLREYKTNIEPLTDASWIYNLRPVTFDWKDDKEKAAFGKQIGLIAEEVQPHAPLLTFNDDQTGKLRGVAYEKLAIPLLVELQKQNAELQKLKREVDELKKQLTQPNFAQ